MTKKDYIRIAAALKQAAGNIVFAQGYAGARDMAQAAWLECVMNLASTLHDDNPRFDRSRFLAACGVTS